MTWVNIRPPVARAAARKWHKVAGFWAFLCQLAVLGTDPEHGSFGEADEQTNSDCKPQFLSGLRRLTLPVSSDFPGHEMTVSDRPGDRGRTGCLCHGPPPRVKSPRGNPRMTGKTTSVKGIRSSRFASSKFVVMTKQNRAPLTVLSPGPRLAGTPSKGR